MHVHDGGGSRKRLLNRLSTRSSESTAERSWSSLMALCLPLGPLGKDLVCAESHADRLSQEPKSEHELGLVIRMKLYWTDLLVGISSRGCCATSCLSSSWSGDLTLSFPKPAVWLIMDCSETRDPQLYKTEAKSVFSLYDRN